MTTNYAQPKVSSPANVKTRKELVKLTEMEKIQSQLKLHHTKSFLN